MAKLNCAILDDYQQIALKIADWSLISNNIEIKSFEQHFANEDDLVEAIRDYQIVVIMRERTPFKKSLLQRLPNLKLLITTGMRNASIDLSIAASQGVIVCGTQSLSSPPVELTWALILSLARSITQENDAFKTNGVWQNSVGKDLNGKQLGLLGLGKIGSQVARIGIAFGMKVSAWSQNLTREKAESVGVGLTHSKEQLLEASDFVSIHLILSERTKHLVGRNEFKRMRTSAYLINTSRAQIVETDALVEALQNNWIAGAGIDVFEVEPLPKDDILRSLPNLLATPHLGYVTEENYAIYFREAIEDISAYQAGLPIRVL